MHSLFTFVGDSLLNGIATGISNCLSGHSGAWTAESVAQTLHDCAIESGWISSDATIAEPVMNVIDGIKNCLSSYGGPWTADGVVQALGACAMS